MRSACVSCLCLALLSSPAMAVDWHLGVGVADELNDRTPSLGGQATDAEIAGVLVAGAEFDGGWGVEASWLDLGEIRVSNIADAGYRVDGDLWSIGATWSPDTGDLRPYGKLGWFSRSEDGRADTIGGPQAVDFDDDGLMAELGARWHITDRFALRAGYAWYDFEPDADGSVQVLAELRFN